MEFPKVAEQRIYRSQINRSNTLVDGYKALVNPETEDVFGIVSEDYQLTRHEEMLDVVDRAILEIPEFGTPVKNIHLYDNGGKLRAQYVFKDVDGVIQTGARTGDKLHPQIEVFNSYDLGWSRRISFGAYRLVCTNGLVIGEKILQYQTNHRAIFDEEAVKFTIMAAMDKFSDQQGIWQKWVDKVTTPEDYIEVMEALPLANKDVDAIGKVVETSSDLRIQDIRLKTLSYWLFFNILCQYVTHHVESHLKRVNIEAAMRRQFGIGR